MAAISAYPWPGNVRALRHALERAVILCDGDTLRVSDFPLQPAAAPPIAPAARAAAVHAVAVHAGPGPGGGAGASSSATLAEVERKTIALALQRHQGNVTHAAQELGITRTSLYRRMEKYGL
jgi:DNA-binding NtrC family response regulator